MILDLTTSFEIGERKKAMDLRTFSLKFKPFKRNRLPVPGMGGLGTYFFHHMWPGRPARVGCRQPIKSKDGGYMPILG
jgi:hypothetical protein